jgi:SAM-dependent methyltransferase
LATTSDNEESIDFYDDKNHDYEDFWLGRDYEHLSEVVAIKKLLGGHHYGRVMDYGGGYGRLSSILLNFADKYILVDPSQKQLDIGKKKLNNKENVEYILLDKKDYVPAEDDSLDLLVMVRVSHHLRELGATLSEIQRALKPNGQAIIEIANYAHFINRMKHYARFKKLPKLPVQVGTVANGIAEDTPFVNHNPKTVVEEFKAHNLHVLKVLSVSNLRKGLVKKALNVNHLVKLESFLQPKLASVYFGPSIFFLVEKTSDDKS